MSNDFCCPTLPDPLLKADGTRITDPAEWPAQAARLRQIVADCYYGVWPGRPASLTAAVTASEHSTSGGVELIREQAVLTIDGAYELDVRVVRPACADRVPVIVYNVSPLWPECPAETAVLSAGYALVTFNREQLAPDLQFAAMGGYAEQAKSRAYPPTDCGTIMTWAWGHSLVADWLADCDFAGDLICTGHSRGGKAALCAGIFDPRYQVVAPVGSGCGGTGCARFTGTPDGRYQDPALCETIGRMAHAFPDWMGKRYGSFGSQTAPYPIGDETSRLPFDAHTLRALCAPRAVFCSEGIDDKWCNTFGTQLCWQASQPLFALLGVPEANGFHLRPGAHAFNEVDWLALLDFCGIVLHRSRPWRVEALNRPFYQPELKNYAPWL